MPRWSRLGARTRLVVVLGVLLALVVAAALVVTGRLHRTPLDRALGLVPADAERISFTDWRRVRERLAPRRLTTDSGIEAFLARGYDADLTAASSIDESAVVLHDRYGFSPTNAEWEAFAQSGEGAVMVLQMPGGTDMEAIARRLHRLGYDRPSSDAGVWRGGADLVAEIDASISPELQNVVVDADRHLVLSSDSPSYAARAERVVVGAAESLADADEATREVAGRLTDPAAAFLWSRDFACTDLSMTSAGADDQERARRLVEQVGGVRPLRGMAAGLRANRTLDVVLGFESDRQAKADLRPRARLLVGPAVVRTGSYADDLRLTRSRTDGPTVDLTLRPRRRTGPVLGAVSSGPVLFATC